MENERRTRTRSYDWMRARYESTLSDLGTLLPERADATEVAAAPRNERKETFNAWRTGSAEERRGRTKGRGGREADLVARV